MQGKDIYCFYTHGGSDKNIVEKAKVVIEKHNQLCSIQGFVTVLKNKETSQETLKQWLASIQSSLTM